MSSAGEAYKELMICFSELEDSALISAFNDIKRRQETGLLYSGALMGLRVRLDEILNRISINPLKVLEEAVCFELARRYCAMQSGAE